MFHCQVVAFRASGNHELNEWIAIFQMFWASHLSTLPLFIFLQGDLLTHIPGQALEGSFGDQQLGAMAVVPDLDRRPLPGHEALAVRMLPADGLNRLVQRDLAAATSHDKVLSRKKPGHELEKTRKIWRFCWFMSSTCNLISKKPHLSTPFSTIGAETAPVAFGILDRRWEAPE